MRGMGYIEGGWEFVWAAYGVTAVVLVAYAVSVFLRYRAAKALVARERRHGQEARW
jgi:heme exporter protein CcmD